ncbi:Adaptor protein complex 2 (AP-2), alpha subunitB [Monocercomonoides exilis]|uniref:Adaptor protein complex 2 (AP-2), alpha subunitB n=1 Tax=Monocercomonoides exilis TaxID=2049356 RepID=UPI00355A1E92|nr:Adaptor protein complex 2 (AP-2), alpha subunitB [Monocercomonoides exilis]|eukprot:MONOS_1722.1-p1 / transcript=MONOS_1722.1 / gene=MONOS_1722 / organism=Monocercomonoides_exilis_PA203 / gene_product= Adaptor protein complex 2 (AP-2), alpha subunit B / transcript_product= Adaptor protein complex 2 (AP-2), alpha subunit B / location=Mono_scaffold00032:27523-31147(+) / protein_length=1051 / sequence_SO=supercontig / SO=protein_coding / is_pseudo=false
MSSAFKGLNSFISDIRFCKTHDQESDRVEKELSHIREAFVNPKKMDLYERKKFVLKLMYIDILGYSVDFGHMEAMELIHSHKFQDKVIGYTVIGSLVNEKSELVRLINQALLTDLTSVRECVQCLALAFIANCGNAETAETLANNVAKILMNKSANRYVIKKASLTLLHLFRKNSDAVQPENMNERIEQLLQHSDGGVLTAVMSLLHGLAVANSAAYKSLVPVVCRMINQVVLKRAVSGDYMYDHLPAPWLIVKVLQFLQHYPEIESPTAMEDLLQVLRKILNTDTTKFASVDPRSRVIVRHNAMLAVLFETVYLAVSLRADPALIRRCVHHMRSFLAISDPDIRYLSLEALQRLCTLDPEATGEDMMFVAQVERLIQHPDISLRRRALDVLFELCNEKNSDVVVGRLVEYLDLAEYEIKEELVLKIAILAEKYPISMEWYVNIILHLLRNAGDTTPQEIWYRTAQIVSANPAMQPHAATTAMLLLQNASLPDNAIRICAYLLGEHHSQVPKEQWGAAEIVEALGKHLTDSQNNTRAIILSAIAKIAAAANASSSSSPSSSPSSSVQQVADAYLSQYSTHIAEDPQERSCEFLALLHSSPESASATLAPLPPFQPRQSILLRDLKKKVKESGVVERASKHLEGIKDEGDEEEEEAEGGRGEGEGVDAAGQGVINGFSGNVGGSGGSATNATFGSTSQAFPVQHSNNSSAFATEAAQAAPSSAVVVDDNDKDMIDLSGFGVGAHSSSSSSASASASSDASSFDPAALLANLMGQPSQPTSSSSSSSSSSSLPPPESNPLLEQLHNALICNVEGKLYEDANLCITCHHEYQRHEGRMLLTWTNKTGSSGGVPSQALMNVAASVQNCPELSLQIEPIAPIIHPAASVTQHIVVSQTQPALAAPVLCLSYSAGVTTHRSLVKLPCIGIKFFQPVCPPKELFVQQWGAVPAQSPLTVSEQFFFHGMALNPQTFQQAVAFLQGPAKMQPLAGYDSTPQTLCFAAGVSCSGSAAPLPLMLKMQMSQGDGKLMLTVKGSTPQVAEVTRKFVIDLLKQM